MSTDRLHRAASADGTRIAGRVHGDGPPIVFIASALGDETTSWAGLVPLLADRFTCYVMSTRGRGVSEEHPDHSRERLLEDVIAFVESIGAPVGLVGHSSAGALALEVASRCAAVGSVVVYEPTVLEFGSDADTVSMIQGLQRVRVLAEQDRLVEAAEVFVTDVVGSPDDELRMIVEAGGPQRAARYVPTLLTEVEQSPPGLSRPEALDRVPVPVLVLTGSRTRDLWHDVSRALVDRLARAEARTIDGVAHFAPVVAPDLLAPHVAGFFAAHLQTLERPRPSSRQATVARGARSPT